jgi:hypothetical protein
MGDFNFSDTITNAYISGLGEELGLSKYVDVDYESDVYIKYHVEFSNSRWGIDSYMVTIDLIKISIDLSIYNDEVTEEEKDMLINEFGFVDGNDKLLKEMVFNVNGEIDNRFEVISQIEFSPAGQLGINEVEVDLINSEITIS